MTRNRQLWTQDNLSALKSIDSRSAGLVYLDPPFASNRDYEAVHSTSRLGATGHRTAAFGDRWSWNEAEDRAGLQELSRSSRGVAELVKVLASAATNRDLAAYLLMMAPRLAEARRILHDKGSLYLHCDPSASHYLKVLLDRLFGPENFRNEIIWKRTHAHSSSRRYGPVHDTLLFYSRTPAYTWNPAFTDYEASYVEKHFRQADERGKYQLITCTAPGERPGTRAHYEWRGQLPPPGRHWAWQRERMQQAEDEGQLVYSANGVPRLKRYVDDGSGLALQDLWVDIRRLDAHSEERVGYDTQKPLALLERIVAASTEPGDLVVDPFCGTGTTMVAAETLGRDWLGIDASLLATSYALARIRQTTAKPVVLRGFPASDAAALRLLKQEPQTFGVWGTSMLATLADRKATSGSVASGRGRLKIERGAVDVLSWVPLKSRGLVPGAAPSGARKRLPRLGLVLRTGSASHGLRTWLSEHLPALPIHEVDLGQLVSEESLGHGMPGGLTAWARGAA